MVWIFGNSVLMDARIISLQREVEINEFFFRVTTYCKNRMTPRYQPSLGLHHGGVIVVSTLKHF